jgi:hypothetical protein
MDGDKEKNGSSIGMIHFNVAPGMGDNLVVKVHYSLAVGTVS